MAWVSPGCYSFCCCVLGGLGRRRPILRMRGWAEAQAFCGTERGVGLPHEDIQDPEDRVQPRVGGAREALVLVIP